MKNHKKNSTTWQYLISLSNKELAYNWGSTLKISLVVAFITLPLILLSTVGENFINFIITDTVTRFEVRKIRAIVGNPSKDSIKPKDISMLLAKDNISFVQPISTRGIQIIMKDESMEDFEAVATSKGDPKLNRIGFSGSFVAQENWLIIHERYAKNAKIDPKTKEITVVVSSISESGRSRQYIIPFKIAATYNRGGGREVYLPIELMDRFDSWRRGYAVPEWKLPGREDQEVALGAIYFTAVRVFLPYKITDRETRNLQLAKYGYKFISKEWNVDKNADSAEGLHISRSDKRIMSEHDLQTIKDVLIRAGTAVVVPEVEKITITTEGKSVSINSSNENDPWKSGLLIKGSWLAAENEKLQIVIPQNMLIKDRDEFPFEMNIRIANYDIPVQVQGVCKGEHPYTHPRTVYRLDQVAKGKAVFDSRTGKFGPAEREREYVAVYVYANLIEQVKTLEKYLQEELDYVTESYSDMIENIEILKKRIRILIGLLAIAGFFAVILSIAGTMGEAVRRKRRFIGLMRAMGVARKGVACFFFFQALSYGTLGIVLACLTQSLATWTVLERPWLYSILKADPDQHLFWPSIAVWGIFAVATILICGIAGAGPAVNATKFEPGEILSSGE